MLLIYNIKKQRIYLRYLCCFSFVFIKNLTVNFVFPFFVSRDYTRKLLEIF